MLSSSIFKKYLDIPWRELDVDFRAYYDDLIKLVIWEDYGVFDEFYSSIFLGLTKDELYDISLMLKNEHEILKTNGLEYHAKNSMVLLSLCNSSTKSDYQDNQT